MSDAMRWVSYGGGVNSTALLVGLLAGRESWPWRVVWADTRDEREETYQYVDGVIRPWLRKHGRVLETVCAAEGVLARWERLAVTGSRILRTCTVEAKIYPIERHITAHGKPDDVSVIGIDAGERHRAHPERPGARRREFPLLAWDWGREECIAAIEAAGLPVPRKSGCWHCPFMRRGEIVRLAADEPCKFERIIKLEDAANAEHGAQDNGAPRMQWHRPAREIRDGGPLFADASNDLPCGCFDGTEEGGAE